VIVMLTDNLIVIDCKSPGNQRFDDLFTLTLNESPVTCCKYYADCPDELKTELAISNAQSKNLGSKKQSKAEWPISGGQVSQLFL